MRKLALTGAATLASAGLLLGIPQISHAETDQPSDGPSASSSSTPRPGPGKGPQHLDLSALAERLGVEESALKEAFEAIRPSAPSSSEKGQPPSAEAREQRHEELAKALAEKLGLDKATVSSALTEMHEARNREHAARLTSVLEQAVTDGTLTQTEADAVAKAAAAGLVGPAGPGGGRR